MSASAVPYNIQNYAAALAEGLSHGDRVHLGVCGNHVSENVFFVRFHNQHDGIVVVRGSVTNLGRVLKPFLWGDIVELWVLEEKPNIYHSDEPEVAAKLRQLKSAIQKCVEDDNSAGVLYLLDQVAEVKRIELLLKEIRQDIAAIQF